MPSDRGLIRPYHSKLVLLWRLADAAWIGAAHAVPALLHDPASWGPRALLATFAAVVAFLFAAEASGLYSAWRGVPMRREVVRVWAAWGVVAALLLFAAFALKQTASFSRVVVVTWFVGAPLLVSLWRLVVRATLEEARRRGRNTRRVAIVGLTEAAEQVATRLSEAPWLGMELVGFFDDRGLERCHRIAERLGRRVGRFDDLVREARAGRVDVVYLALPLRAEPRVSALLRRLADTTASVYFVPDLMAFDLLSGQWTSLGDLPVVSIFESPFYGVDGWVKRIEDIVLGGLSLAVAAGPMVLIALLVKLTSPGPVFFRQRRYGLDGEVIYVLKFRTMRVAEDGAQITQASRHDARITPLGAFLRRTSLDELPQLLHVVAGTMSLVGPRPHAVAHNEEYRTRIHGYMLRHKVKPGLTGWAQVNGWRGETDTLEKMARRVEHDLEYIRRWGLLLDLKIIALTLLSPKAHRNAY
jgi:putative colanic acid biosynthesis UDP-glucose lipid carrier transferase